ncbi:hypothetical protein AGLY_015347, partial [Aphis glycines]
MMYQHSLHSNTSISLPDIVMAPSFDAADAIGSVTSSAVTIISSSSTCSSSSQLLLGVDDVSIVDPLPLSTKSGLHSTVSTTTIFSSPVSNNTSILVVAFVSSLPLSKIVLAVASSLPFSSIACISSSFVSLLRPVICIGSINIGIDTTIVHFVRKHHYSHLYLVSSGIWVLCICSFNWPGLGAVTSQSGQDRNINDLGLVDNNNKVSDVVPVVGVFVFLRSVVGEFCSVVSFIFADFFKLIGESLKSSLKMIGRHSNGVKERQKTAFISEKTD